MFYHTFIGTAIFLTSVLLGSEANAQNMTYGNAVYANTAPFSVKCDGVTDDTNAINYVLNTAVGREIIFPAGVCPYRGGGRLHDGTTITGAGRNSTIFKAMSPDATLFVAVGEGSGLRNVKFTAGVLQTGGHYVILGNDTGLGGFNSFLDDFTMSGDFNGILLNGNAARIRHGRFLQGAPNSIRIRAEGGDNSQVIDDVLIGAQDTSVNETAAGIRVRSNAALIINNTSVLAQGVGLLVDPESADESVHSLVVNNSFFDGSTRTGVMLKATNGANIVKVRMSNVWIGGTNGDGLAILNHGTGIVSGISLTTPHILLNGSGSGVTTAGAISDFSVNGGAVAGNLYGFWFGSGISGIRITNAAIGKAAGENGNTSYGIVINSGVDYITLANNDLRGNGSPMSNASSSNQYFKNNIGISAVGPQ